MSIEQFKLAAVACVLALLAACGGEEVCRDGACACGNGVVDPGEQCDGAELAGGTCMDAVQRGGTLRCSADCTFDVRACTLASCGNGVIEDGEACDGASVGDRTCDSIGYGGGDLACKDCALDTAACCVDACASAGLAQCVGNSLRVCGASTAGCLAWEVTDCAANNDICEPASLTEASCTCVDRCALGEARCEGASIESCMDVGGCLGWVQTTNCSTAGDICATAPSGPLCAPDASAENCADPYPLAAGDNVVAWTAVDVDYLSSQPSCNTNTLAGPDIVLSYTATEDAFVTFTMNKPASARQTFVVSAAACGTVTPEVACAADTTPTSIDAEWPVTMGTTYHVYIRDTSTGAAPLDNPLFVNVAEAKCSAITNTVTTLAPANGLTVVDRTPIFTAQFAYPIDSSTGVVTVTGNLGTNLSYNLATGPTAITIVDGGRTLHIDPGLVFPDDEVLTVSWTGLMTSTCNTPVAPPAWSVQVTDPSCAPGQAGMVGTTQTRIATGLSTVTEYYVETDQDPNGYVYVGGTSTLYRMPKSGGTTQNVATAAALSTSHLGYDVRAVGSELYTVNDATSGTSGIMWRVTTDGGSTWSKQDYMQLPFGANDDVRSTTYYQGRIYFTTSESTNGTEIWSVPAGGSTIPQTATRHTTVLDEDYCSIAVDDDYYYLACYNADRLLRVNRTTLVKELVTDKIVFNSTKNAIHAHDIDNDGRADVLYAQGYGKEVHYVCSPNSGPFYTDVLTNFGTDTANYGLGFDKAANVLWMFDDDTREFVKIE